MSYAKLKPNPVSYQQLWCEEGLENFVNYFLVPPSQLSETVSAQTFLSALSFLLFGLQHKMRCCINSEEADLFKTYKFINYRKGRKEELIFRFKNSFPVKKVMKCIVLVKICSVSV